MDSPSHLNRWNRIRDFFRRFSESETLSQKAVRHSETLKVLRSIGGVLLAIALAWTAKTETENRQRIRTLSGEWPREAVWRSWFQSKGWVRLAPSRLRKQDQPLDPSGRSSIIWFSRDPCLVLLDSSPYRNQDYPLDQAELWTCQWEYHPPRTPVQWIKFGSGFEGFNRLTESMPDSRTLPSKKPVPRIDPREIRY